MIFLTLGTPYILSGPCLKWVTLVAIYLSHANRYLRRYFAIRSIRYFITLEELKWKIP